MFAIFERFFSTFFFVFFEKENNCSNGSYQIYDSNYYAKNMTVAHFVPFPIAFTSKYITGGKKWQRILHDCLLMTINRLLSQHIDVI